MEENKMYKYGIYIFSFVIVVVVLSMYFSVESSYVEPDYLYMEDGWNISGDLYYENVNLSSLVFKQVRRGQEICFENTIPDYKYNNASLVLYTIHSAVRICVDDKILYEYGFDRAAVPNKLVGYGFHMVDLPHDCQGKNISIYIKVSETNAFTNFDAPWICNGTEYIKDYAIQRKVPLFIIAFLIIIGILVFLLSLRFGLRNKGFNKLACIGGFSLSIGLWSLCNYDIIFLFTYNPLIKTYMEFVSLYVCSIPLIFYFWDDIHQKTKNWITIWYFMLMGCQITFTAAALILQTFEIVSLPMLLPIQHILLCVLSFYLIETCIYDFVTKTYNHIALAFGIAILFSVGVLDIVRFNIQKYVVAFQGKHYTSLICVGTLIFIICQLIDYAKGLEKDLIQLAQTEMLQKWAYIDELTGLYNRRKCEQEFDEIEENKEPCGIFSFDLNNLKTVNDTFGHEKGDEMIKTFADVLTAAYKDNSNVLLARTGGDEFLAICRWPDEKIKKYYIDKINEMLTEASEEKGYLISVAIGYSHTRDFGTDSIKATLRRADQKMYKYKSQMKSEVTKKQEEV